MFFSNQNMNSANKSINQSTFV